MALSPPAAAGFPRTRPSGPPTWPAPVTRTPPPGDRPPGVFGDRFRRRPQALAPHPFRPGASLPRVIHRGWRGTPPLRTLEAPRSSGLRGRGRRPPSPRGGPSRCGSRPHNHGCRPLDGNRVCHRSRAAPDARFAGQLSARALPSARPARPSGIGRDPRAGPRPETPGSGLGCRASLAHPRSDGGSPAVRTRVRSGRPSPPGKRADHSDSIDPRNRLFAKAGQVQSAGRWGCCATGVLPCSAQRPFPRVSGASSGNLRAA